MSFYKIPLHGMALSRIARGALRCVPLFVVALVFSAVGYAQGTGSVHGHVKNLATGKYLTNALVVIEETGRSTYTNEYGEYRFNNVPSGQVTVKASYVGLGEKSISVSVSEGVTSASDIALYAARADLEGEDVFELEAFTVEGSDYDSNAIAQQERKTSANLKLVQHADALGDIAEGNIGEFLKNMPGIAIDYVASDARSIKLRGMGAEFTTVTIDGAPMASANSSGANRSFELEQVSLSNVEQLEVYKLPRPDNPANSIGGSVNLVSRNAFSQGGRKIKYKAYLTWNNTTDFTLNETPGWTPDAHRAKVNPNFELSYSDVFLEGKLGASFTYSQSNKFNVQQRFSPNGSYRVGPDGTVSSDRLQIQDGPKFTFRQSIAGNFDYKATENTILTLRYQRNWYEAEFANRNRNWIISSPVAVGNSTISGTFSNSSSIGGSHRNKAGETDHIDIGAKHTFGDWKIDYGYTFSEATNRYRDISEGYVEGVNITGFAASGDKLSLNFDDAGASHAIITATNSSNAELDDLGIDLSKGRLNWLQTRPFDSVDKRSDLRANVSREFEVGEHKGSIKFGFDRNSWDRVRHNRQMRFNANAGSAAKTMPVTEFLDEVYYDISPGFGTDGFMWPSQAQIRDYFLSHGGEFTEITTPTNSASNLRVQYGARLDLTEIVTSYYLMGSIGFMGDKGLVTTGVRYEHTDIEGYVPFNGAETYVIGADGDLQGEFFKEEQSYGTYHPSVHIRYNITNKLVSRLSFANTLGRPNFPDMFGPATIRDPSDTEDETDSTYSINVKNPGLQPRRSNNVDLTFEYYAGETSMISASLFQNKIKNFIGNATRPITAEEAAYYGLSSDYPLDEDDKITTRVNAGDATVSGIELNWNQGLDFGFVPEFLKASSFYANGTFLDLKGEFEGTDFSNPIWEDNLPGFSKETISYGFLFKKKPFSLNFRWNIRGEEVENSTTRLYRADGTQVASSEAIYRMHERRTTLDVTGEYKLNDRMSLYFAARNATNSPYRIIFKPEGTAGAKEDTILQREELFGADWTFGVKGTF